MEFSGQSLPFVVLVGECFRPEAVRVLVEPTARPTTPELERLIAEEWDRQTILASRAGRLLFNGELLRYVRHEVAPGADGTQRLDLAVGPTCYRDFVGTNLFNHHRLGEFAWESFANPIGTTATLITGDGYLCYGRRSLKVAYHGGYVHTFGGALEEQDLAADGRSVDAFASVLRELREEVGLDRGDIAEAWCVGMIRDKEIWQPELLFDARTELSAAELSDRWSSAEAKDEHDGLVSCLSEPDAIVPFILGSGAIAPVAIGAMFLHGRRLWGEAWYRRAAEELAAVRQG